MPLWVKVKLLTSKEELSEYASLLQSKEADQLINSSQNKDLINQSIKAKNAILIYGENIHAKQVIEDFIDIQASITVLLSLDNPISILDVRTFSLIRAKDFRSTLADKEFDVKKEIIIAIIPQENDFVWLHTKGMIKFGQPELSIRDLPKNDYKSAFNYLNILAAQIILENKTIKHESKLTSKEFPNGIIAKHAGQYGDDEYWGSSY